MSKYVGAIDQGTRSTRFVIFDKAGKVVASQKLGHKEICPKPGWVEHDPWVIWIRTQGAIKQAMHVGQVRPSDLAAIGICNQRETTLIWDKITGKPFSNAIVWQDTRTGEICDRLAQDGGCDRFRETTGLPLATYFSGPKIKWMLDNIVGLRRAADQGRALFGNIDSWLIWLLTGGQDNGVHVTDVSNASRTMLMNLSTLDWDEDILRVMNIPRQMLPKIRPSSDPAILGTTLTDGPLGGQVPITGDLGDQQAALFGQTCFERGDTKNTYGIGCFALMNTGTEIVQSKHGLLSTVGYKIGDNPAVYALEGSIANAGTLVHWLRDNLGLILDSPKVEKLARTVDDSGGIYIVPAFSGLFAPYWRPEARGIIAGLTRNINKGHIARAVLEATAYQTREVIEAMREDSGVELPFLKVDGGMVANDLLMQFQSDILGAPVIRPAVYEITALGVAYAAGLAIGFWHNESELKANYKADKGWRPQMNELTQRKNYKGWLKAVERTFDWVE